MNRDERSLLLFLETRAVDHGGLVDTVHMNEDDVEIAKRWTKEGFLEYGRVCAADVKSCTAWVELSEEAWELAHKERRARADRMWAKRTWRSTAEYRDGEE
jgi:hypothetical protein